MIDYKLFLEQILNGYKSSYDIERVDDCNEGIVAKAVLHMSQTQNFLFKEFQMYSASDDEYVSFIRIPKLTSDYVTENINNIYDDGLKMVDIDKVTFNKQHMCTRFVVLFLCDEADESAIKAVTKCRLRKSFQFSLKGWIEVHSVVVVLNDGTVKANPAGRETAKFLKKHVKHFIANM